jgi:hypothetical protein
LVPPQGLARSRPSRGLHRSERVPGRAFREFEISKVGSEPHAPSPGQILISPRCADGGRRHHRGRAGRRVHAWPREPGRSHRPTRVLIAPALEAEVITASRDGAMIELYDSAFSPFARKVRMVLDHKALNYETVDGLRVAV